MVEKPKELVLDCEVLNDPEQVGWDNYEKLGISVAVVWDISHDKWYVYTSNPHIEGTIELKELPKMLDGNHIIGHNIKRFDIPLVKAVAGDFISSKITDFWDAIYKFTGHMVSLDHIVTTTKIGEKTLPNGTHASLLWNSGEYARVIEYCKNDVWLEGNIYLRVKNGGLTFPAPMPGEYCTLKIVENNLVCEHKDVIKKILEDMWNEWRDKNERYGEV